MKKVVWSMLPVLAWVCSCGPAPSPGGAKGTGGATPDFTVQVITAERSGAHVHLTVVAKVKNQGAGPLTLSPPAAQLWAGAKAVESFIAPGLEPAEIPAGAEAEAATHWWLSAEDLSGALVLETGGARVGVKSGSAFALDLLPERKAVSLSFPEWKIR